MTTATTDTNQGTGFYCTAPLEWPNPWTANPDHKGGRYPGDCWLHFATRAEVEAHRREAHPGWVDYMSKVTVAPSARPVEPIGVVDDISAPETRQSPRPGGAGPSQADAPTPRQLSYIADLAQRKGVDVPEVKTRTAAGVEIDKLLAMPDAEALRPNRYAGPCSECGVTVEAGEGFIRKVDGRWLTAHKGGCPEADLPPVVPDGRYAVDSDEGHTSFYRVTAGRKPGIVFVDLLVGGGANGGFTAHAVPPKNRRAILAKIVADDPEQAARRFGRETGVCCRCARGLTHEASRAEGIGPECARR